MLVENVLPIAAQRLITIQAGSFLTDAAVLLSRDAHISLVVVCDPNGVMVGVITKTDIVRQVANIQGRPCTIATSVVMTRDVTWCRPDDTLHDVLANMKKHGFVHVPILDQESRPAGVLNVRDGLQALLGEIEHDVSLLRDYVTNLGYH
jgi:CBS domain-containing protein